MGGLNLTNRVEYGQQKQTSSYTHIHVYKRHPPVVSRGVPRPCSKFFFFSSRRRHTSSFGDWSSDVCSSDLWPATCSNNAAPATRSSTITRPRPSRSAPHR